MDERVHHMALVLAVSMLVLLLVLLLVLVLTPVRVSAGGFAVA